MNKLDKIGNISEKALQMKPQKNLDLKKWNENSKELSVKLIGHIFAYWTLLGYKDMNYKTKDR